MSASRTGAAQRFRYRQKRRWDSRFQIRTAAAPSSQRPKISWERERDRSGAAPASGSAGEEEAAGCAGRFEPDGAGEGSDVEAAGPGAGRSTTRSSTTGS